MVNLTTLAPDIVAAILADNLPDHITLLELAVNPPALWDEQRERLTRPVTAKQAGSYVEFLACAVISLIAWGRSRFAPVDWLHLG